MYKKILVPTDGSDTGAKVIPHAVALAKSCGAAVVGLNVTDPYPYSGLAETVPITADQYRVHVTQEAEDALKPLQDACKAADLTFEPIIAEDIHPWKAMLDVAKERGCDLVVIASHGRRGMQALLLGSETQKLLTHSTIPVLVLR
ncbi:MAG TPA: universal stress protein [Thiomonas arsenitoxydans]|jgi:nucleotide-binding universal stress UspA family protein|uniref:UspA domain protein n=1 Tax=Thiomonas intermedia (strain K12) TaxID=75379 RepID=D5X1J7_THIK1|nr:universal stress protein [Thiomonas sp.]HOI65781.1 universal stress protein [Thiomonas arsenitoxydans]